MAGDGGGGGGSVTYRAGAAAAVQQQQQQQQQRAAPADGTAAAAAGTRPFLHTSSSLLLQKGGASVAAGRGSRLRLRGRALLRLPALLAGAAACWVVLALLLLRAAPSWRPGAQHGGGAPAAAAAPSTAAGTAGANPDAIDDDEAAGGAPVPRTAEVAVVEDAAWEWGACGGDEPLFGQNVCGRTFCLRSLTRPGVCVDVHSRAFGVMEGSPVAALCQEPAGGQVGPRLRQRLHGDGGGEGGGMGSGGQPKSSSSWWRPWRRRKRASGSGSGSGAGKQEGSDGGDVEVSFIVTHKGQARRTAQCLLELLRTAREAASAEFVIVEDGGAGGRGSAAAKAAARELDRAIEVLRRHFGLRVARLRNRRSRGYGAANNQGARAARGRFVVFMVGCQWLWGVAGGPGFPVSGRLRAVFLPP